MSQTQISSQQIQLSALNGVVNVKVYVDGNRVDSYTETGSEATPFKTINAALNYASTHSIDVEVICATAFYNEILYAGGSLTGLKNVTIKGNNSSLQTFALGGSGYCYLLSFTMTDMIVNNGGYQQNFNHSNVSCTLINCSITGNLYFRDQAGTVPIIIKLVDCDITGQLGLYMLHGGSAILQNCTATLLVIAMTTTMYDCIITSPDNMVSIGNANVVAYNCHFISNASTRTILSITGSTTSLYNSSIICTVTGLPLSLDSTSTLNLYNTYLNQNFPVTNSGTINIYDTINQPSLNLTPAAGAITPGSLQGDTFDCSFAVDLTVNNPAQSKYNVFYLRLDNTDSTSHSLSFAGNYLFSTAVPAPTIVVNGTMTLLAFQYQRSSGKYLLINATPGFTG